MGVGLGSTRRLNAPPLVFQVITDTSFLGTGKGNAALIQCKTKPFLDLVPMGYQTTKIQLNCAQLQILVFEVQTDQGLS